MAQKIALDIGEKRTGIAITDTSNIIASGLTTVATNSLIDYLKELFQSHEIDLIAVGKPINLNGSPTDASVVVEKIHQKLTKEFSEKKICFVDERFTSKLATNAILLSGAKKKQRKDKALVDKVSATIILQTYLEIYG